MKEQIRALPWGTRKRLHYLEFKIFWEGRANRGDLKSAFGISIPQASADIARYQDLTPQNIIYNSSAKYYIPTEEFNPILIKPSADGYFSEIISSPSIENNTSSVDDYVGFVPNPTRIIDVPILKTIIQAIKNKRKITVDYRSFKNPQAGNAREITPHSFGSDGFRWHVRAYCHTNNKFKDYVLGRIVSVSDSAETEVDPKSDRQWFNFIDVIIGPNPNQNEDQKYLIAMDYGMTNQRLVIRCRVALLYYLMKKLRIDIRDTERPGNEQQIVAINIDEISAAMNSD